MSAASRITARLLGLGPRRTGRVASQRDVPVHMPDGAALLTDRWYPEGIAGAPIVLMRSPYGRSGYMSLVGRLFAERGYQAVIQSCRGTAGSGGEFVPFRNEAVDGCATHAWLERQDWFSGRVATWGGSYLGITQWASADAAPPWITAMATAITASQSGAAVVTPGGAFALESVLRWASENALPPASGARESARRHRELGAKLAGAYDVLPLSAGPAAVVGRPVGFYQDWLEHDDPADPWWRCTDFRDNVEQTAAPVSMVAGWYDMFLPYQLRDFAALQAAGRAPRIIIGPWAHGDVGLFRPLLRDAFEWFDHHLLGVASPSRKAVRLRLLGSRRWVEFDRWPPADGETVWYLHPQGGLSAHAPGDSPPDRYRYDPADPTPGVGGASLSPGNRGAKDQRQRAQRADVLTYTSPPFARDTTYVGPVSARLHLRSSLGHTDFHVTLCDVAPRGRSTNVSSGIARLRDAEPDTDMAVTVEMWPIGCTFAAGHRLSVHVSSGAHPTYARNPGTGDAAACATTLAAAEQQVFHDPVRASRLIIGADPL